MCGGHKKYEANHTGEKMNTFVGVQKKKTDRTEHGMASRSTYSLADTRTDTLPTQLKDNRNMQPMKDIAPVNNNVSRNNVTQRLVNPAPAVGSATSYQVTAADLGNGTGTTAGVRAWAQANAPGPNPINFRYAPSDPITGALTGAWIGPFMAPNLAPAGGANWHAGHILARQNGGLGHLAAANWIMPQNPQVNMGHAGTYGQWRAHEVAFNGLVAANGAGVWDVW